MFALRLVSAIAALLILTACGGTSGQPGPGLPTFTVPSGVYNGNFQVNDESNDIFMNGLTTFTISSGAISGSLVVNDDFDFPGDTATLSGNVETTSNDGSFEVSVSLDFQTAPDYTASGKALYSEQLQLFQIGNVTLKQNDAFVGSLYLDGNIE